MSWRAKLDDKVAVINGGKRDRLATAKLFVEEGAFVLSWAVARRNSMPR